jgi:hypothetical protein
MGDEEKQKDKKKMRGREIMEEQTASIGTKV